MVAVRVALVGVSRIRVVERCFSVRGGIVVGLVSGDCWCLLRARDSYSVGVRVEFRFVGG